MSGIHRGRDVRCHRVCKDTLWFWSLDVHGMMAIPGFACHQCADDPRYQGTSILGYTSIAFHTAPRPPRTISLLLESGAGDKVEDVPRNGWEESLAWPGVILVVGSFYV